MRPTNALRSSATERRGLHLTFASDGFAGSLQFLRSAAER